MKFFSLFRREVSRRASKAAADALWSQEDGAQLHCLAGKILFGCGVGWVLLSMIPIVFKEPVSNYLWMLILAAIQLLIGAALVILSKKSEKFRKWAARDFKRSINKKEKLAERLQIGNITLPVTRGDVLACAILGIIAGLLILILRIGYGQGWVQ